MLAALGMLSHMGLTLLLIPLSRQLEPLLRDFELSTFVQFMGLLLGVYAAKGLFFWVQSVTWSQLVFQRSMNLRLLFYRQVMQMPLNQWQIQQGGDLQARLTVDIQELEQAHLQQLSRFFPNLLLSLLLICYLLWVNPLLTGVTALLMPLGSLFLHLTSLRLQKWSHQMQTARGKLYAEMADAFQALPSLRPLRVSSWFEARLLLVQQELLSAMRHQVAWKALQSPLLGWIQALALGLVLLTGAWQVQTGQASVADLVAFGTALALGIDPVLACVEAWGHVQIAMPAQMRLQALNEAGQQLSTPQGHEIMLLPLQQPVVLAASDISFAYPGQPPLFEKISLALSEGQWTVLVGPSGSGKSTLLHLLTGALPLQNGQVYPRADVENCVLLPQKSAFLNLSVKENLLLGRKIDAEFLDQVLEICQLRSLISALPDGLDTLMGNQGSLFSGGERQRFALARALLAQPQLLILDEATSELDPVTESHILTRLKQHFPSMSCLWVSHRPESLTGMGQILRLQHGTISVLNSQAENVATNPNEQAS